MDMEANMCAEKKQVPEEDEAGDVQEDETREVQEIKPVAMLTSEESCVAAEAGKEELLSEPEAEEDCQCDTSPMERQKSSSSSSCSCSSPSASSSASSSSSSSSSSCSTASISDIVHSAQADETAENHSVGWQRPLPSPLPFDWLLEPIREDEVSEAQSECVRCAKDADVIQNSLEEDFESQDSLAEDVVSVEVLEAEQIVPAARKTKDDPTNGREVISPQRSIAHSPRVFQIHKSVLPPAPASISPYAEEMLEKDILHEVLEAVLCKRFNLPVSNTPRLSNMDRSVLDNHARGPAPLPNSFPRTIPRFSSPLPSQKPAASNTWWQNKFFCRSCEQHPSDQEAIC